MAWERTRKVVLTIFAAALLGVALLVLFVQIGGSLNKDAPERDGVAPLWDNA